MPPIRFTKRFLILCEGASDKAFFSGIVELLGLEALFDIWFPQLTDYDSGGRDKFGQWLTNVKTQENFIRSVEGLLVVSDKDEDAAVTFPLVQGHIAQAGLEVPPEELLITPNGRPRVAIMMLPLGLNSGCLESHLLEAAYYRWPQIREPLDQFVASTPVRTWPIHKQNKSRIQSIIASVCQQDPEASLRKTWERLRAGCGIPLDHVSLEGIRAYLQAWPGQF